MNVLGVILARGGSKGVKRKNMKPLANVPLVAYTIIEAQRSRRLTRLILSSEDREILELSSSLECEIILRPSELASDSAASPPCLIHAVEAIEKCSGFKTDVVVLLQPTTPFRTYKTIDACIELLLEKGVDSVVSVMKAPHYVNPHWVRKIEDGFLRPYLNVKDFTRRQDLPEVYWRNGQVYAVRKEVLFKTGDLYGEKCLPFIMDEDFQINIDHPVDFRFAEYLLEKGEIDFDAGYIQKKYKERTAG
ncbi:MAG: acylneuraminate cytidylyltransferase family protein [Thermodesulfobacteriota bacterium]|nr:acylneuraminate cytidylyltransferase family protein [Thermodesulfobacteriota bacterium]